MGFSSIKTYIHDPDEPTKAGKHKQLPIEEKESFRWLESVQDSSAFFEESNIRTTIQDREGDIYELFATLPTPEDHLIVCSRDESHVVNPAGDRAKLYATLSESPWQGQYSLDIRSDIRHNRQARVALMQVRWVEAELQPPARLKKRYLPLKVWAVEAQEAAHTVPSGEPPIHWRLLTTHAVANFEDACQMIYRYSLRWYAACNDRNAVSSLENPRLPDRSYPTGRRASLDQNDLVCPLGGTSGHGFAAGRQVHQSPKPTEQ